MFIADFLFVLLFTTAVRAQTGGMGCSGMMCGMGVGMVVAWVIGLLVLVFLVVLITGLLRR